MLGNIPRGSQMRHMYVLGNFRRLIEQPWIRTLGQARGQQYRICRGWRPFVSWVTIRIYNYIKLKHLTFLTKNNTTFHGLSREWELCSRNSRLELVRGPSKSVCFGFVYWHALLTGGALMEVWTEVLLVYLFVIYIICLYLCHIHVHVVSTLLRWCMAGCVNGSKRKAAVCLSVWCMSVRFTVCIPFL